MDNVVAKPTEPTVAEPRTSTKPVNDRGPAPTAKEMPLEIYQQETKSPYINELLQVDDILPLELKENIGTLDEYVTDLMNKRGYGPTTEAYKATLEKFKSELGIDENTTLEASIERMTKYIEAEKMLRGLKTLDEDKILKQLKKSPTSDLMRLVMKVIEPHSL